MTQKANPVQQVLPVTVREILERAHTILAEPVKVTSKATGRTYTRYRWTKGREVRNQPMSDGTYMSKYCALGAISAASKELGVRARNEECMSLLAEAIDPELPKQSYPSPITTIINFNDAPTRHRLEVVEVFEKAIKLAIEDEERAGG